MLPVTLLLFTASVAVPAGLFGFLAWESRQDAMNDAFQRVEQTTGILHEHALKVLEINAGALERVAQYLAAAPVGERPRSPMRLQALLSQVGRSSPSVQSLWVFAADGSAVATSLADPPPAALRVLDRDYFRHHQAQADPHYFVSVPLIGRHDGRQQFALTRRLDGEGGTFSGIVISGIQSDYFVRHWQGLAPELAASAALVRDDGVILVRYPPVPITTPALPVQSDFMQAILRDDQATRQMASALDGGNRIVGFRRLHGYPVSIAYAVSLDAVLAGWHRSVAIYAAVCGSAALALLAMTALVHRRYRIERRLAGQLRRADESRTRFFANVSHELRTPLALILGPVDRLLKHCPAQGEEHRELEVIQRSAQALLRRVNDLLDIARLGAGRGQVEYARIDLAQQVRLVCSCFESAVQDTGLRLEVDAPAGLSAEVDAPKTERILFNLLSNAFKFTPAPGCVRVSLSAREGQACLSVQDTGPGVPPHLRQAVFERFRQASSGPEHAADGTGLGLAIVREFVQLHAGRVWVEDAPGGGALFRTVLPLHAPPGTVVADAAGTAVQGLVTLPAGPHGVRAARLQPAAANLPCILVVEDHPDMNAHIAQALAHRYRVLCAGDGEDGLEQALRQPHPDLIVLDMMMPGLSGEETLARLRREPALQEVPVLVLTARADDELQSRVLRQGAQDFVQKPFAEHVLLERIARLLADREHAAVLLRRSDQRMRDILETAKDAIIVADGDGRIVLFNEAAQGMFGYRGPDVIGEKLQLLLSTECWENCPIREGARPGGPIGPCATGQARRASGELFPVECSMSRLDRDHTFHTVILRDVTERLRDRQALLDAHEELQRVTQGFQRQLIGAVEARQARIARDLHDSVGASLAGVSLLIGSVQRLVPQAPAGVALDRAQEQVAATADAVRSIARGLMPAGIDSGGLVQALEQFATDLADTRGVVCTLRARGSFSAFHAEAATHVFRIVQEAAANAMRHGGATRLRIALCERRGCWRVSVSDNGTGCDFTTLSFLHPGLGLRSMQARARALDGELHLLRRPAGGCRVRVDWNTPGAANLAAPRAQGLAAHQHHDITS